MLADRGCRLGLAASLLTAVAELDTASSCRQRHDGLRDPLHLGRAFTPNQKYAALTETAGYVPLALSPEDHIELLRAT